MQKHIYLYRIIITLDNQNFYYFGIRTCYCDPKDDSKYLGSPKTHSSFWQKTDKIKKDILVSEVFTDESFERLQQKETEIIRFAQKKYGIYEEDENGNAINDFRCLNVGIFPTLAMTPTIKKKIGAKNSIHQRGTKNSQYGNCWIRHPDFGPKTINKKMLIEFIEQGWFLGRKDWKNRIAPWKNLEKTKKYEKNATKLFEKLANGNYTSISDFIKKTNYQFSNQNLIMLWKKYIPGFSKVLIPYKSFSSEAASSFRNNFRSVGQSG